MSLEYQVGPKIAFATTLMLNLRHITLSPPVPDDNTSVALRSESVGGRNFQTQSVER